MQMAQATEARTAFHQALFAAVEASSVEAARAALQELKVAVHFRELSAAAARDAAVQALRELFERGAVTGASKLVAGELRRFAGLPREEIERMLRQPGVSAAWREAYLHKETQALKKLATKEAAIDLTRQSHIQPYLSDVFSGPPPPHPLGSLLGIRP